MVQPMKPKRKIGFALKKSRLDMAGKRIFKVRSHDLDDKNVER